MNDLRALADAKIDAARKKLLASLHNQVEAAKARQSSRGMLQSGNTLVEIVNICSLMMESLRDVVIAEYQWVLSQSLPGERNADALIVASRDHVGGWLLPCDDRLKREGSNISAQTNAIVECSQKLKAKNDEVC